MSRPEGPVRRAADGFRHGVRDFFFGYCSDGSPLKVAAQVVVALGIAARSVGEAARGGFRRGGGR